MWLLLLACDGAPSSEPPLEEAVVQELRGRLPEHEVRVEEGRLLLIAPDGFERPLYLEGLRACRSDCEAARIAWVEEVGQQAAARTTPFRAAQLRPRLFPEEEARHLGGTRWEVGHGLVAVLVQDTRVVRDEELEELDDPRATALLNLKEALQGTEPPWPAEALLVPELWESLRAPEGEAPAPSWASAADRDALRLSSRREELVEPVFRWTGSAWE